MTTSQARTGDRTMQFSDSDKAANLAAFFYPAVAAEANDGTWALPCIQVGGVQVYAYVRDGILVVSLDYDTADVFGGDGPFRTYDELSIPTVIKAGDAEPVWTALPDDAVTEDDARILRRVSVGEPNAPQPWIIPDWVNGE